MVFAPTKNDANSPMAHTNYGEINKSTPSTKPKNAASTLPMDTAHMARDATLFMKRSSLTTIFKELTSS